MVKVKKTNGDYGYFSPFPTRLRSLLEKNNLSQEELANYVGVKRQSIASWKDGKTLPDIESLLKISEKFNVSSDFLLGKTEDPKRNPSAVDALGLTPGARDILENDKNTPKLSELISSIIENKMFFFAQLNLGLAVETVEASRNYDEITFKNYMSEAQRNGLTVLRPESAAVYHIREAQKIVSDCIAEYMDKLLEKKRIELESYHVMNDDN